MKTRDIVAAVSVAIVCLLLGTLFLRQQERSQTVSSRMTCIDNLKQVGLSFRVWPGGGDQYPMKVKERYGGALESTESGHVWKVFQVLSNELQNTKFVICPADKRTPATSFEKLNSNEMASYFVGPDAEDVRPNMFLSGDRNLALDKQMLSGVVSLGTNSQVRWTSGEIHHGKGNICLGDGSVQTLDSAPLRRQLAETGDSTNRIVFPQ